MGSEKERTYIQCMNCGHTYIIDRKIPMSVSVINSYCTRCGNKKGLNCGYSEDDVMELKDYFLDWRYI